MTWSAPMTAIAGAVFAAADFNRYVRDNLNMTAPALATAAGQYFVATGTNALAARSIGTNTVSTSQGTSSNSYTDLATVGPSVSVVTGVLAIVIVTAGVSNSVSNANSFMSYQITGATPTAASNTRALRVDGISSGNVLRASSVSTVTLLAGTNVFTAKYLAGASSTATFTDRTIQVIPL